MDDFSWVKPATSGLANMFGLNPELAAKGRNMQSENDLLLARTRNTDADTALNQFRQKAFEGQANNYNAGAEAHRAQAGKFGAEAEGTNITNAARRKVSELIAAGAIKPTQDGGFAISPEAVNGVGSALAAMDADPKNTMEGIRGLLGNAAQTPRAAAQTRGIAAAFEPNASFSAKEGQQIEAAKAAASQAEGIAVQQERNKGSLADTIAKGGPAAGQPDQIELNRQAEGIKLGAEWAMKVPWQGGYLDEGQALQLSQAARAANPGLSPQDAIVKFVKDNPKMMEGNWEAFGKNAVDFPKGIPTVVPSAPAAPAAPAPAAQPGAGKSLTKQEVLAMPDGAVLTIQGTQYRKQGGQLVKVK